jgi:signal transduction histidine kinase
MEPMPDVPRDPSVAPSAAQPAGRSISFATPRFRQIIEQATPDPVRRQHAMSTVAHDMRGALLTVRMGSQMILSGLAPDDQAGRDVLGHVLAAAAELDITTGNLMEALRLLIDAQVLHCKATDVVKVIRRAIDSVSPIAAVSGHRIEQAVGLPAGEPVMVEVDAERLRLSLASVLMRAVKVSPSGSVVKLAVHCDRVEGVRRVVIEVMDRGRMIEAGWEESVFEPLAAERNEEAGRGLTLVIARQLVQQMGGQIVAGGRVDPGSEEGSTLTVTLPVVQ